MQRERIAQFRVRAGALHLVPDVLIERNVRPKRDKGEEQGEAGHGPRRGCAAAGDEERDEGHSRGYNHQAWISAHISQL